MIYRSTSNHTDDILGLDQLYSKQINKSIITYYNYEGSKQFRYFQLFRVNISYAPLHILFCVLISTYYYRLYIY